MSRPIRKKEDIKLPDNVVTVNKGRLSSLAAKAKCFDEQQVFVVSKADSLKGFNITTQYFTCGKTEVFDILQGEIAAWKKKCDNEEQKVSFLRTSVDIANKRMEALIKRLRIIIITSLLALSIITMVAIFFTLLGG